MARSEPRCVLVTRFSALGDVLTAQVHERKSGQTISVLEVEVVDQTLELPAAQQYVEFDVPVHFFHHLNCLN